MTMFSDYVKNQTEPTRLWGETGTDTCDLCGKTFRLFNLLVVDGGKLACFLCIPETKNSKSPVDPKPKF